MKLKSMFSFAALSFVFSMGTAQASILAFDLDFEFSGATAPTGATPWITATFDDSFGGANTVRLTMSATNLVNSEFVDEWIFNFDPSLDPTQLTFANVPISQTAGSIATGVNAFQADGDGKFDIEFDFPAPNAQRFTAGEISVYDITYVSPIDVTSFNFQSVQGGGNGTFGSAAHIQGIDPGANESGWIGPGGGGPTSSGDPPSQVPEPGILALFGTGLLGFGLLWRRRRHV